MKRKRKTAEELAQEFMDKTMRCDWERLCLVQLSERVWALSTLDQWNEGFCHGYVKPKRARVIGSRTDWGRAHTAAGIVQRHCGVETTASA